MVPSSISQNNNESTKQDFSEYESVLLEEFRQLAKKSEFPIKPRLDDEFISRFLRARKYNVQKALSNLQSYYRNIHRNLDYIKDIQPSQFTEALRCGMLMGLKGKCRGHRVGVARARMWDPKVIKVKDLQMSALYQTEYSSLETDVQDMGGILVVDISGASIAHIMKLSLREIKRTAAMVQDGTAIKIYEAHLINPHYIMWPLFHLIMGLLKAKLRKRLRIHYTLADFHKCVDREILPKSLGGYVEDSEAFDTDLIERIIKENYSCEDFWNPDRQPLKIETS